MSTDYDDYTHDNEAINNVRIFTIVIASISAFFPLSVVVILAQKYNTLVREKSLVHYVMMIAIADTITAISIAFGYPGPGPLCSTQGFLLIFFSRMSWFFTDVLIFQLFYIVVFKKFFLSVKYMHCIVWPLNILLQLLPYTTGTNYGEDDGQVCFFGQGRGSFEAVVAWNQYAFTVELLTSFVIIIILTLAVVFYCLNMNSATTSNVYLAQKIRESWSIVILYPCAMLIAWVPGTISGSYLIYLQGAKKELPYHILVINNYLTAINALNGPLLALIFYSKTLEARQAWIRNFRRLYNFINSKVDLEEDEDEERCGSIISTNDIEITTTTTSMTSINPISKDITRIDE